MTDDGYKTLRVPEEDYKAAKEKKETHDRTWGEQLVCGNVTTTEVVETAEVVEALQNGSGGSVDLDELEDRIVVRLARETEADIGALEGKLDDLENRLPRKVAEELEGRR